MWWVLACASVGPRMLPEAWSAFDWPGTGQDLHERLWRELSQRPDDWQAPPVSASEVHVGQWWCGPGVPEDDCWTGVVARGETRDTAWRGLSAVTSGGQTIDQLVVDAGNVPAEGDWGVALNLRLDAQDGALIAWDLGLVRWAGTRLTARIDLGPDLSHGIEQSDFAVPGPDFETLLASPESFRSHIVAGLRALLVEVERGVAAHEVRKCAYGRYWGDGSPRCDLVPLNPQEEAGALEQARNELNHRIRLVEQDAETLQGLLQGLVPETLRP